MAACMKYFWGLFLSLSLSLSFLQSISTSQVYIVYLGVNKSHDPIVTSMSHIQLLSNVFPSEEEAKQSILYHYKHGFSDMKEVISVFRSQMLSLHTTRSWDFVGLTMEKSEVAPLQMIYGDNIVVGIFDTGIWPESESFKEEAVMGPTPSTWKGKCVDGEKFDSKTLCNRKLIGARYYLKGFEQQFGLLNTSGNQEYRSARDSLGHGTHTASTTVGSITRNSSFLGLGQGTARGGAPKARLAAYKVCWGKNFEGKCAEADILAAFDDALHDGVNVISASFGLAPPLLPFFASSADIGSFHAMQLGVTVVFSAGNDGPDPSLVSNVAPWGINVAASSIDRNFPTQIVFDGNFSLMAESLITREIRGRLVSSTIYFANGVCAKENWNRKLAIGRVILCFSTIGSIPASEIAQAAIRVANASALIYVEPPTKQLATVDIVPTVRVDISLGTKIQYYLAQSLRNPVIQILPSKTAIGKLPAPVVAHFSSRGPSSISPDILKPDVTAPGINILAAWPPTSPPSATPGDDRSVKWNFQSGTSMSCPHVSGIVALLKSAHPDWSPAAIRSALITTAHSEDSTGDEVLAGGSRKATDPFDIGAGHVNPTKAIDPGLVYDMKTSDYIIYVCNIGYTQQQINNLVLPAPGINTTCARQYSSNANINYPSITVSNLRYTTTIKRTIRNVGSNKNAVYFYNIVKPNGVEVVIWPKVLIFSWFREEVSFFVTIKPLKQSQGRYDFGEIVWSDGFHIVRSPLVVSVNTIADSSASATATYSSK